MERFYREVETESINRRSADDPFDAFFGGGLVDVEGAGAVDVENVLRGSACGVGNCGQMNDTVDVSYLFAHGFIVGGIAAVVLCAFNF